MKIIINNSSKISKNAWYYDKQGEIFNVLEVHEEYYRVGKGDGYRLDVFKKHCTIASR